MNAEDAPQNAEDKLTENQPDIEIAMTTKKLQQRSYQLHRSQKRCR